jgi:hypothetical protein
MSLARRTTTTIGQEQSTETLNRALDAKLSNFKQKMKMSAFTNKEIDGVKESGTFLSREAGNLVSPVVVAANKNQFSSGSSVNGANIR